MQNVTHAPIKHAPVKQDTPQQASTINSRDEQQTPVATGGLLVRTDLRAGIAWDDLDDQAKSLWDNLTNMVSGLSSGTDASS